MEEHSAEKKPQQKTLNHDESLEPVDPYTIMAKLFAHLSKSVVDRFGEAGKEAIREGVRAFGEERGRDIARRAAAAGQPNDIRSYLPNYDMGRSDLFEYVTEYHPQEIEQSFTRCAFGDQWKKDGMEEYGILYCQMIDPAIARGYNADFEVEHDKYLLKDGYCHFRFKMKGSGNGNGADAEKKRDGGGNHGD
ncbi:hypothetical protein PACILC2_05700 [Paenibacillus cisolokensis]|uniref:L-2-amino-thiazoline-4-carboxylic acid hydrolase n=1 Tax=Paenibacillus cisolokensis TaxID=1658519 RepID=A0ABQ4N1I3_9BACL|nr:L-2-amino-thiazoline-4-carboxylic acid hydrolase [Paenibacillus cisolokensis]GIQ62002.1 hypothetical protein PACILC2_05700 [Paenibacillus cisolokensis]